MLELGREARIARHDRGLSLEIVARAAGISDSMVSRIERGRLPDVGIVRAATILGVVGLDLTARAYPGGQPLRDQGHARLLGELRRIVHRSLG
jgi:transcriptional regulator with XRE-family HTH domain